MTHAQITVLTLIALKLAKERGKIDDDEMRDKLGALKRLPELLRRVLDQRDDILQASLMVYLLYIS